MVMVVLTILLSALAAGYEAVQRLLHPRTVEHVWAVALASVIGFAGNELVALFRLRVGKQIHSAALVADGYHARVDGLTSLAVLAGAVGIWLGYPQADPIVGLLITFTILRITWQSAAALLSRLLDAVDPEIVEEIRHSLSHTRGVRETTDVRVRWMGHRPQAEVNLAVDPGLSLAQAHEVSVEARHGLLHQLPYLSHVTIHVDPADHSGEVHHRIPEHSREGLPSHSHP